MTPHQQLSTTLTDIILPHLKSHGRYHLPGFGVWTLKTTKARRVRNPATGELMWLPAGLTVRFHAAKRLRKAASRLATAKASPDSTGTAVQRHNEQGEAHR